MKKPGKPSWVLREVAQPKYRQRIVDSAKAYRRKAKNEKSRLRDFSFFGPASASPPRREHTLDGVDDRLRLRVDLEVDAIADALVGESADA